MEESTKIGNLILTKFVNEEIMTKSEFQLTIDRIMDRHEASINAKFATVHTEMQAIEGALRTEMHAMEGRIDRQFLKIDNRYNWIIGLVLASGFTLAGMMLKVLSMLPH